MSGVAFAGATCLPSCSRLPLTGPSCPVAGPRWSMGAKKGFGPEPEAPREPSEKSKTRDAAGGRLESMRLKGMPEFSIWFRLLEFDPEAPADADAPEFPWLPIGSLSIPRSGDINKAIYNVEEDLMAGLYKLFPNAKGKEDKV
jgi:Family of unknown function (DUF6523)